MKQQTHFKMLINLSVTVDAVSFSLKAKKTLGFSFTKDIK